MSADALRLTSLSQSVAVSSDTSPTPPPPPLQQESKLGMAWRGGGFSPRPPVQHVKVTPHSYTRILCRPAWPLSRVVISHQADQRRATGSERSLTRRSPSGWQAIAHALTAGHTLPPLLLPLQAAARALEGARSRAAAQQERVAFPFPSSLFSHQ